MSVMFKYKNKKTGTYISQEDFEKLVETKYDKLDKKSDVCDYQIWAESHISPFEVLDWCTLGGVDRAEHKMRECYREHLHDKAEAAVLKDYEIVKIF